MKIQVLKKSNHVMIGFKIDSNELISISKKNDDFRIPVFSTGF